jgi:hypothetical protein
MAEESHRRPLEIEELGEKVAKIGSKAVICNIEGNVLSVFADGVERNEWHLATF